MHLRLMFRVEGVQTLWCLDSVFQVLCKEQKGLRKALCL